MVKSIESRSYIYYKIKYYGEKRKEEKKGGKERGREGEEYYVS